MSERPIILLLYHKAIGFKMTESTTIFSNNLPTSPYQVIINTSTKEISLSHFSPKQLYRETHWEAMTNNFSNNLCLLYAIAISVIQFKELL